MGDSWGARVSMQFGSNAEVLADLPCRGAGWGLSLPGLGLCLSHLWLTWSSPTPVSVRCPCCCGFCQPFSILPVFSLVMEEDKTSSTGLFLVAILCTGGDATNPYRVPHFPTETSSFSDSLDFDETPCFLRISTNPNFSFSTF